MIFYPIKMTVNFRSLNFNCFTAFLVGTLIFTFLGCNNDDPTPANEEEVITTLQVTLAPAGGGIPITLKFFDADGEQGSAAPVITVSGQLKSSTQYAAVIDLRNETVDPAANVSEEVAQEAHDHLFCFTPGSGIITVQYEDADSNGLPLGLISTWQTGAPGKTTITISLRHQAGTKTGECPGTGETDLEVTFDVVVE